MACRDVMNDIKAVTVPEALPRGLDAVCRRDK
jgi:hypothetical protein